MKKLFALILCLLLLSVFGLASAEDDAHIFLDSGTCGENLTWTLDIKGALTISGNGEMENWPWNVNEPWHNHRDSVNQIIIEEGITSISAHAFQGCKNVETVKIPDGVTVIGNLAFADCTSLSMVYIPDSVTNIVLAAFSNCTSLSNVTIPCYLSPIDEQIFAGCTSLTEINVSSYNAEKATVQSVDGVLFSANGRLLVEFPAGRTGYYSIPDGVTTIGSGAFDGCLLSSVRIPDSVSVIGSYAFGGCRNLASVLLPDGITEIYFDAFGNCMNLKEITIPATVKLIDDKALGYHWNATEYKKVEGFTIHGRIGTEAEAYAKANGFQFVPINTQKQIVSSGTCGENLTWTLDGDGTLTITGTGSMDNFSENVFAPWFGRYEEIKQIVLPNGLTSIGEKAFYFCSNVNHINIPDTITEIGKLAFYGCWGLAEVSIPNSVEVIGEGAFYHCINLSSITIPDGIKTFDGSIIGGTMLSNITIPKSVETVVPGSFTDCGLSDIFVNEENQFYISIDGVLYTKNGEELVAFPGGRNDGSFTVPNGVKSIGQSAFTGNYHLAEIYIPSSVASIGQGAFSGCENLADVYYGSNKAAKAAIVIDQWNENLLDAVWHFAENDSNRLNALELPVSVTTIDSQAFTGTAAEVIIIPESCTSVAADAFRDCPNLKYIVNRSKVTLTPPDGVSVIAE